jgi:hypothetical protein
MDFSFAGGAVGLSGSLLYLGMRGLLLRRRRIRDRHSLIRIYAEDPESNQLWVAWPRSASTVRWFRVRGTDGSSLMLDGVGLRPIPECESFAYAHLDGTLIDSNNLPPIDPPPGVAIPRLPNVQLAGRTGDTS